MANVTIYVSPKIATNLTRLRARLKREGSSLSKWFDAQVRESEQQKKGDSK